MISTIQHRRIFASRGYGSGGSGSGTGFSGVVNTYSDLPAPASSAGEFYYVQNSQGTSWLPGSMGGTYYPSGVYYSTGTDWITGVSPWQATQAEVDAGLIDYAFVSPKTLANTTLLQNLSITQGVTPINSGIDQGVLFQSGGVVTQSNVFKFDTINSRFNINNVTTPIANINIKATSTLTSDYCIIIKDPLETHNRFQFGNDGNVVIRTSVPTAGLVYQNTGGVVSASIGLANNFGYMNIPNCFDVRGYTDVRNPSVGLYGKAKFLIGGLANSPILPNEPSTNIVFFKFGTNPGLNYADGYQQYAAGSSSQWYPEFRLSDGKVVKLQPIDSSTISSHTDLVNALISIGILY